MPTKRSTIAACVLALVLAPAIARADDDASRARALFDEAGELERQGQWSAAQERLRAALRIKETPHLRYALGWALENDDRLLEARAEYEAASRLARDRNADEVLRLSGVRLADLEKKTPVVQVKVGHASALTTRVVVDGRPAAIKDDIATVPVNPGSRVVRVERPGKPPTEQLVYVSRGETRLVDVDEEAVASRTAPQNRHTLARPAATKPASASGDPVLPWALVGGGAALLVGAGALLVSSSSDASTRDENQRAWCEATACTNGTTPTRPETAEAEANRREAVEAADRGNVKQIVGFTLGITGLVSAAVGTWMLLRDPADRRGKDSVQKVRVSAAPLGNGAFAGASFRF